MKTLIHIVVAGTIVYVLALVLAFFWQRNMIYFPPEPAQQPFDIHLRSDNTVLGGWIVPGADPGAIVLFGGNAMAMSNWRRGFPRFGKLANIVSTTAATGRVDNIALHFP